jgi:hypothetical protein
LNTEKRETLRGGLGRNDQLHKDPSGLLWMMSESGRLDRVEQSEIRAKPTTIKAPDSSGLLKSVGCDTDGWLYVVGGAGRSLCRLRRNPVSHVEELQVLSSRDQRIVGLACVEQDKQSWIVFMERGGAMFGFSVRPAVDEESLPELPVVQHLGHGPALVGSLTLHSTENGVWNWLAVEGVLDEGISGGDVPHVVRWSTAIPA